MKIEHSSLKNEFISFWFETHVDGVLCYETIVDFMKHSWCTTRATDGQPILLRGELDSSLSDEQMVESIKPKLDAAVMSGQLK